MSLSLETRVFSSPARASEPRAREPDWVALRVGVVGGRHRRLVVEQTPALADHIATVGDDPDDAVAGEPSAVKLRDARRAAEVLEVDELEVGDAARARARRTVVIAGKGGGGDAGRGTRTRVCRTRSRSCGAP